MTKKGWRCPRDKRSCSSRALDKAISVVAEAGRAEMVRALESSRAGVSEQLVVLGVRLPDRKAKRGGRKEVA